MFIYHLYSEKKHIIEYLHAMARVKLISHSAGEPPYRAQNS